MGMDIQITKVGSTVLIYETDVVEEYCCPDLSSSYNHEEYDCPNCSSDNTCIVKYPNCPNHSLLLYCYVCFCLDCELAWENRLVEEYKEEGGD